MDSDELETTTFISTYNITTKPSLNVGQIFHLPDAALSHVSSFLPFEEKMLLVLSLPTKDDVQRQETTKAIIGTETVESIDFFDFGEHITSALTDNDLHRMLACIDAVRNLKVLKLTHCFGIEGHGLAPLRGSSVLQQIDLSLVARYELPSEGAGGSISTKAVLPILNSILDSDRCSLRHVQLPKKWQDDEEGSLFHFLSRYNHLAIQCKSCNSEDDDRGRYHGQLDSCEERRTCYECTDHYCRNCSDQRQSRFGTKAIEFCQMCEKSVCHNCIPASGCIGCTSRLQDIGSMSVDSYYTRWYGPYDFESGNLRFRSWERLDDEDDDFDMLNVNLGNYLDGIELLLNDQDPVPLVL